MQAQIEQQFETEIRWLADRLKIDFQTDLHKVKVKFAPISQSKASNEII